MQSMSFADELAEIRGEIARLKAREAALRAHFLRHPDQGAQGRWARVEVVENRSPRFNPLLLPDTIRNDPRFFEEKVVQTVRCLPAVLTVTMRPGWPIARGAVGLH